MDESTSTIATVTAFSTTEPTTTSTSTLHSFPPSISVSKPLIPTPTVPPRTLLNGEPLPYLARSAYPKNFLFIVIGDLILLCGLIILIWRCASSYCMNRNIRRQNAELHRGVRNGANTNPNRPDRYTPFKDVELSDLDSGSIGSRPPGTASNGSTKVNVENKKAEGETKSLRSFSSVIGGTVRSISGDRRSYPYLVNPNNHLQPSAAFRHSVYESKLFYSPTQQILRGGLAYGGAGRARTLGRKVSGLSEEWTFH